MTYKQDLKLTIEKITEKFKQNTPQSRYWEFSKPYLT